MQKLNGREVQTRLACVFRYQVPVFAGLFIHHLLAQAVARLVVDTGGFTRAGERVHRTQSTVSQQIRRLDESLGYPASLNPSICATIAHWKAGRASQRLLYAFSAGYASSKSVCPRIRSTSAIIRSPTVKRPSR